MTSIQHTYMTFHTHPIYTSASRSGAQGFDSAVVGIPYPLSYVCYVINTEVKISTRTMDNEQWKNPWQSAYQKHMNILVHQSKNIQESGDNGTRTPHKSANQKHIHHCSPSHTPSNDQQETKKQKDKKQNKKTYRRNQKSKEIRNQISKATGHKYTSRQVNKYVCPRCEATREERRREERGESNIHLRTQ